MSYLDPASYETAGIYTKLLLFSSAYSTQLPLAVIVIIVFALDYLFGDTISGALAFSVGATLVLGLLILPNEVSGYAQALTRSGQTLSTKFAEVRQALGA